MNRGICGLQFSSIQIFHAKLFKPENEYGQRFCTKKNCQKGVLLFNKQFWPQKYP